MSATADRFSRGMTVGKAGIIALIFSLSITVIGLPVTLAAGPDLRPLPKPVVAGQPPSPVSVVPRQSSPPPTSARPQAPPRKPAKIKLQRNAKGDYTWDITGESVEEILQNDRRLRKALVPQEETGAGR